MKKPRHPTAKARFNKLKKYYRGKFEDTDYFARKMRLLERELDPLLRQPHADYSSRSEANLKAAAAGAGIKKRKYLKAIPYPAPNNEDFKVTVKRGKITVSSHFLTETDIEFDQEELAENGADYVRSLLRGAGQHDLFQIKAGSHVVKKYGLAHTSRTVADQIAHLQMTYSAGNTVTVTNSRGHREKREITEVNDYSHWLIGLKRFDVKNQADQAKVKKRLAQASKDKIKHAKAATKSAKKARRK